jgi:hypothetical protein
MKNLAFGIMALLILGDAAHSQSSRQPLGANSEASARVWPGALGAAAAQQLQAQTPVPNDGIRFVNIANRALDISYWNGDGKWETLRILSGNTSDAICPKCGNAIILSFPNGQGQKRLRASAGVAYTLYWSDEQHLWDIYSSAGRPVEINQ